MKKSLKRLIIIAAALAVFIGLPGLTSAYFTSDYHEKNVAVKNSQLTKYTYSRSGDMQGSSYEEEIKLLDDGTAVRTVSSREWYDGKLKVEEHPIDPQVLADIEAIFRRYHMRSWEHRKISRMFIADGANKSYVFCFGDTSIGFSEQYYPGRYGRILREMEEAIARYT